MIRAMAPHADKISPGEMTICEALQLHDAKLEVLMENSAQTLALVESSMPDVLLLDLGIAPRRGLELVRRVKSAPGAPAIVALALFDTPEALAAARRAGADELVGKERFIAGLSQALARLFPSAA